MICLPTTSHALCNICWLQTTGSLASLPGEAEHPWWEERWTEVWCSGRGHLTRDQKGFHTTCGQLFKLSTNFVPWFKQLHLTGRAIVQHQTRKVKIINYCCFQQGERRKIEHTFLQKDLNGFGINSHKMNAPASPTAIPPELRVWQFSEAVSHWHVWTCCPLIIRVYRSPSPDR